MARLTFAAAGYWTGQHCFARMVQAAQKIHPQLFQDQQTLQNVHADMELNLNKLNIMNATAAELPYPDSNMHLNGMDYNAHHRLSETESDTNKPDAAPRFAEAFCEAVMLQHPDYYDLFPDQASRKNLLETTMTACDAAAKEFDAAYFGTPGQSKTRNYILINTMGMSPTSRPKLKHIDKMAAVCVDRITANFPDIDQIDGPDEYNEIVRFTQMLQDSAIYPLKDQYQNEPIPAEILNKQPFGRNLDKTPLQRNKDPKALAAAYQERVRQYGQHTVNTDRSDLQPKTVYYDEKDLLSGVHGPEIYARRQEYLTQQNQMAEELLTHLPQPDKTQTVNPDSKPDVSHSRDCSEFDIKTDLTTPNAGLSL